MILSVILGLVCWVLGGGILALVIGAVASERDRHEL